MAGVGVLFMAIVVAYVVLSKKLKASDTMQIKQLREGTQEKSFSFEILYQKLYNIYIRNPFTKRYLFKVRRRLEIINIDDEYNTRKDAAVILSKALLIFTAIAILTIIITHDNWLLMSILLIFELFIVDTMVDGMVDKIDNNLLREQIDFFAEIRHAYHEYNMVEEAIYQVSLDDEKIGYAGELLSIEIVKKARNTETYTDSDVQQLTVKARPKAPTTVQGVNATEIGGTGMNGMQYKLKRTDEWSSTQLVDTVEVDAGEYNVRKAATDTDFASEETTITVETFIAEKEMTPEIAIDYTTEELINFVEDGTYTINGLDVTLTDNKLSLANYITNEQITLSIVKKGNNVTTVASEAQTLIVKARPAAPTKSEIIVTQPSVIGGKGTIAGIADTMEYSTNNGINWTTGDGDDIGDIEPGTTYKIRYKAVSADEEAERQFKSAEYSVTIIAYDAMPETQPTISINYVNEKLTGFTEGCDYIIKIDDGVATDKDNVTEDIDIDNTYFGHTLKIVKKGDGIKTSNSEAFELSIPKRSSAPNVAAVEEQTYQGNDGKITGVDTTMEYKSLSEPTFTWTQCAGTEITNLAPGSYVVRVAAVADESFASEVMSVTINAAAKDEPTEPTVNITYDDKNGNVNAIFTNITEEGMVYVAEYNENGTLLSIKSDEISDSVIIPFTCVNKSKVKVFIWKNDMKPLFNKVFTLN